MVRYAAVIDEPANTAPSGQKIWARNLLAFYETDPEIIAAVLPKPLEPTEPHVRINFAQVDMESGPLGAGTFSVRCRHGDVEGCYDLLMIMTTEGAVLGGRETFGEPKPRAKPRPKPKQPTRDGCGGAKHFQEQELRENPCPGCQTPAHRNPVAATASQPAPAAAR